MECSGGLMRLMEGVRQGLVGGWCRGCGENKEMVDAGFYGG